MKICINGEILLQHPREFSRLAEALINNADEFYVVTVVSQETGDKIFNRIQSLQCPSTLVSYLVDNFSLPVEQLILEYLREHDIDIYISHDRKGGEYIKKNSNIITLQLY